MKIPSVDPALAHRLPPGQILRERFPILHEGEVPEYDMSTWRLKLVGLVEQEIAFTYEELLAMPQTKMVCDIHCVTRWSKFDTEWEGVRIKDLLERVNLSQDAKFVMIHADHDYEANLPMDQFTADNVMLALKYDGEPLTPKHGWPLRLVVPSLYFWKSPKWITAIEFMKEDRQGFWETRGFHNEADPFKDQRFSGEAIDIPEDEWEHKEFD
ncbi:sulfite oxidase-like oxidoreductase [Paenibacillus albiflavus]|uniref:Sulfite oxidase-like oxidoreductase n=1 Tax=Paenibacillus albiflavus TaxID=2545760 RepID=A0A4R4E9Y2_9BACL|nr:sulfite oxidase-like oxidoreductase [Paenibacillus albiflavus]TCZ76674.1 sulfite oxidase-like oxidoreductase [Paenibacillus albiflavus]